jgi:pimeloyl-ACP methyl ester carboxylesterase
MGIPDMPNAYDTILSGGELRLACRIWPGPSDALPLVLLHGLTESSDAWERIAPVLARRRTVYAWDARGHGRSEWAADAAYAGDAHFSDVASALDALDIERCALAGFSMGGSVAILCAGAMPERVERFVVVDSYPDPLMTPGSRQVAEWLASAARSGAELGFDPAIARAFLEMLESGEPRRLDLWPFWDTATQPALIVRGELSSVLTPEMAAEMLRHRPSARLVTIPGVAHAIPALRPTALAEAIASFLDE